MNSFFYIAVAIQIMGVIAGIRAIVYGIHGVTKREIKENIFFFPMLTKFSGKMAIALGYLLIFLGLFIIFVPLLLFFAL